MFMLHVREHMGVNMNINIKVNIKMKNKKRKMGDKIKLNMDTDRPAGQKNQDRTARAGQTG
jgi:hypothetical protein